MNSYRKHADSALYGLTQFSDYKEDEFMAKKLTRKFSKKKIHEINNEINDNRVLNMLRYERDALRVPKKIDWREKGVVSPVRNQGFCGACWAHSVLETVESMISINNNFSQIIELSVQQMIDCAENSNFGCNGGDTCNLLEWLIDYNISIAFMDEYPNESSSTGCKTKNLDDKNSVQIKNYTCLDLRGKEDKIIYNLAYVGPVVVAINALSWQNYVGGVIQYHCDDDRNNLNHAVQIVGYDMTGEVPFYIIRNTWGVRFGDEGYVKISMGKNLCGLANQVSTINV